MDRNSMLNRFSKLRYCVLWPGTWDDIGFTERPIWVCRKGYGYFYDDEPCSFTTIEGVTQAQVKELKEKLSHGQLNVEDIEGSPFECILRRSAATGAVISGHLAAQRPPVIRWSF